MSTISSNLTTTYTLVAANFATTNPLLVQSGATITVANSSAIYGQAGGAVPASGWTIENEGTVHGNLYGITLASSGFIENGLVNSHAKITGDGSGVVINGSNGTLYNWGSVIGAGQDGVLLAAGGVVLNNAAGLIKGASTGIEVDSNPGRVSNYGSISGSSTGILLNGGGSVTNYAGGNIEASGTGIAIDVAGANGTVTDNGHISAGSTAVLFTSGTNLMQVGPSAQITGSIEGGTAAGSDNILEFLSGDNVTLSGLTPGVVNPGTTIGTDGTFTSTTPVANSTVFQYFGDIDVDAGATLTLTGSNTFGPGSGLLVSGGGTVTNTGTLTANPTLSDSTLINTGVIIGAVYGIHSPDTLLNTGTVTNASSTVAGGEAVSFAAGGYVENGAVVLNSNTYTNFGATLAGYDSGVDIEGAPGTVTNLGTITATSTTAAALGIGVYLSAGGTVNNGVDAAGSHHNTGALIQAYNYGVKISNGLGVVNNDATINATGDSMGVFLTSGGTVNNGSTTINTATIAGENYGAVIVGGPGTINNYCTIIATSPSHGTGALIVSGTINNGFSAGSPPFVDTGALITGYNLGANILGAGTVANMGTISATSTGDNSTGLLIGGAGNVRNGIFVLAGSTVTSATISGDHFGIADHSPLTLNNLGTVIATSTNSGDGVNVGGNATINNGLLGVFNSTTGFGSHAALISGHNAGIAVFGDLTLNNQGTVLASPKGGYGAVFGNGTIVNGGSVPNDAGSSINTYATIKGDVGILAAGTVNLTNWGTVSGDPAGGTGLLTGGNATITNLGTASAIVGGSFGVDVGGSATVQSEGRIEGYAYNGFSGAGLQITGTGTIINGSSSVSQLDNTALIQGPQFGIVDLSSATVTNFGTVRATGGLGTTEFGVAVFLQGGIVVNGASNDGSALINDTSNGTMGVASNNALTITNWGTINGIVDAVSLFSGNNVISLAGSSAAIGGGGGGGSIVGAVATGSTNELAFGQHATATITGMVRAAYSGASTGVLITHGDRGTFNNFGTLQVDNQGTLVFNNFISVPDTIATGTTLEVQAGGYADVANFSYLLNNGSITVTNGGTLKVGNLAGLTNAGVMVGNVTLAPFGVLTNTSGHTISGQVYVDPSTYTYTGTHTISIPIDLPAVPVPDVADAFVTNASSAVINGGATGIGVNDASTVPFFLLNSGTVSGSQFGVELAGQSNDGFGVVANGLQFPSAGPVLVPGAVISGGQAGVNATTPDAIVLNGPGSTITGGTGVNLVNGGIVADAGTITGTNGVAVDLGPDVPGVLYLAPGFVLNGSVVTGYPSDDTLVLGAGSFAGLTNAYGTIGGIGSAFDFGNVYVSQDAMWSLTGTNTIASGYTLSGDHYEHGVLILAPSATLDIEGAMRDVTGSDDQDAVVFNMGGDGSQELVIGRTLAAYNHPFGPGYVAQGNTFFGQITNVGNADTIEIGGVSLGSNPNVSYSLGNHHLTISSNNGTDFVFTDIEKTNPAGTWIVSTDSVTGNVKLVDPTGPITLTGNTGVDLGSSGGAVILSGSANGVVGLAGQVSVTGSGSNNTISLGNGNDTINIGGSGGGNAITLGTGTDVVTDTNSGSDTFTLNGSNAFLAVSGSAPMIFVNGGNDQIALSGAAATSSTIKVGESGGSAVITGFGTGDSVDLVGGLGFSSAADIANYVNNAANSDGHGGTLLRYNGGSIDFAGVAPNHFSAANFSVA